MDDGHHQRGNRVRGTQNVNAVTPAIPANKATARCKGHDRVPPVPRAIEQVIADKDKTIAELERECATLKAQLDARTYGRENAGTAPQRGGSMPVLGGPAVRRK